MKTNSKTVDGGHILNGSKSWITNSPIADVLIIWCKDEQGILRGFIVDRDSKGLSTPTIEGKFALRASVTGQIFLEDVFVPSVIANGPTTLSLYSNPSLLSCFGNCNLKSALSLFTLLNVNVLLPIPV